MVRTTRVTTASGWTNKGAELTSEEMDENFIEMSKGIYPVGAVKITIKGNPMPPGWTNDVVIGNQPVGAAWHYQAAPFAAPSPTLAAKSMDFSPDGTILAVGAGSAEFTATGSSLLLYDTSDWSLISGGPVLTDTIECVRFSPSGDRLYVFHNAAPEFNAYNTSDWSTISGTPTYADNAGLNDCAAVSPDGSRLLFRVSNSPYHIQISTSTWSSITLSPNNITPLKVAYSPDGNWVGVGSWNDAIPTFALIDISSGSGTIVWTAGDIGISGGDGDGGVAFSPDSKYVAFASDTPATGLKVIDTGTLQLVHDVSGGSIPEINSVDGLAFSTDGEYLIVDHEQYLVIYKVGTWDVVMEFRTSSSRGVIAVHPGGEYFAMRSRPLEWQHFSEVGNFQGIAYMRTLTPYPLNINEVLLHPAYELRMRVS